MLIFKLFNKLIKWLVMMVLSLAVVFHIVVVALLIRWDSQPVNSSMFILHYEMIEKGTVSQEWVDYPKISKYVKQAVIASEDAKFMSHDGFDTEGIRRAIEKNQKFGKISAGGSTISQQLAKNLFLTSHRLYIRKAEEAVITVLMEYLWEKERILEVYLNVVEFGKGIYGIEAAAEHYFNKSANELNKNEAALLISLLPRPKFYQKNLKNKHLRKKQKVIIKRMPMSKYPM